MRAAIYVRKSTEQIGVSDEEKSVTRQIEHAKVYATKKGWTVADDLIYADDGISGAEFLKRPGFLRLMNALKPHPPFQILVMSEESRLGRESIETSYALKQIMDAGIRVFFFLEDRERTLDNAMDKVMLSLANFASEMEREKAKQRTYDAMLRKAKAGHVTGGKVYGYDNQEVMAPDGRRLYVLRIINPSQAAVVRRVFEMYAASSGLSRIAKTLNGERVPPPRGGAGWAPSAIREMLYRPLYRGEIVWNEYQKIERGGTKHRRRRKEDQLIKVDAPDLRIITEELWHPVQKRLEANQQMYARYDEQASNRNVGRPALRDIESPYLLSGMARCKHCGGPIEALGRDYSRRKGRYYGCAYHRKRGTAICQNALRVEQDVLDQVVLKALSDVLDEDLLEDAVERALEKLRSDKDQWLSRQTAIKRELLLIETCEKHLVDAIARGDNMDPLLTRLRSEEYRKKELTDELDSHSAHVIELDKVRLKRDLGSRVADAKSLLQRHTTPARQILRKLLIKPLRYELIEENGKPGFRITGEGSYLNLLNGIASPYVVSPTGCDRRWQRVPRTADVRMFPRHKSGSHGHRWLGTVGRRTSHVGSFSASRAIGECVDQGEFSRL
jgi:site-specific DNA recombinase